MIYDFNRFISQKTLRWSHGGLPDHLKLNHKLYFFALNWIKLNKV